MATLRLFDPAGFAAAQAHLDPWLPVLNTLLLATSGLFAALAQRAAAKEDVRKGRRLLLLAALGGAGFLAVKFVEYAAHARAGIDIETHVFFTFYYLLTGFHAAHVAAGIALLALASWSVRPQVTEAAAYFWHMVDLVRVLILPPLYLLR